MSRFSGHFTTERNTASQDRPKEKKLSEEEAAEDKAKREVHAMNRVNKLCIGR